MKMITKKGFTLVELMVVVAIISLLTGIIVTNLTASRSKARDAKRISDMGQIQLALELFFDRCRQYPTPNGGAVVNTGTNDECPSNPNILLSNYISKIPQPSGEKGQSNYEYQVNTGQTDYVLKAVLENYNEVLKDGMTLNKWSSPDSPVHCDNTSGANDYCLSPK